MLAGAAPAAAFDDAELQRTLAREMRGATPASGAYVRDLDADRTLFSVRAGSGRVPASVEKLFTTATSLLRLGPGTTLDTAAVSSATVDATGVLRGDLVLVGAGDPFFGAEAAAKLARAVRAAGVTRVEGAVVGDESRFDRRRAGCCAGYDTDLGGVLSALAYDRGFSAGKLQLDAAHFAATRFAGLLKVAGVRSGEPARAGSAARDAGTIAVASSMDVRNLIRFVNVPSNNFAAEMLLKDLGARYRFSGTTRSGAAVVRDTLARIAVRPTVRDGSGLSRSNRATPRDVVRLLERMDLPDVGGVFRASRRSARRRAGACRPRSRGRRPAR